MPDTLNSDTVRQAGPSRPGFYWSLPNLLPAFDTWEAEIAFAQSQGYDLIIDPNVSTSLNGGRKLYAMRLSEATASAGRTPFIGEWRGSLGCVGDMHYPLYEAGPERKLQLEIEAQARLGLNDLNRGVWFRAACSGLWYRTAGAAGDISEIRVNGVTFLAKGEAIAQ